MSDVERVERLLRSALVPVDPPEALSDRLERGLSELTEVAAAELADWELSAMRDPRNWARPGRRDRGGRRGRRRARAGSSPPAAEEASRHRACRRSRSRSAAWRTTSRSACAASCAGRRVALPRRRGEPGADPRDPDQQVQEVVLGVHRDQVEDLLAVAGDEAEQRHQQVDDPEAERVARARRRTSRPRTGRSRRWRCARGCASRSRRGCRAPRRARCRRRSRSWRCRRSRRSRPRPA